MDGVRRAPHSGISGVVEVMEVTSTHQNVQAISRPGRVAGHTGGAHVGQVLLSVLNPLHNPDLTGAVVPVAD